MTQWGLDCCELSLVYKKETLWSAIFKTIDLQSNYEFIKAKAASMYELYAEANQEVAVGANCFLKDDGNQ